MTIYLIKWINIENNDRPERYACSSFVAAQKKVKELFKNPDVKIEDSGDGGPIAVLKPKSQADVIDLINSL